MVHGHIANISTYTSLAVWSLNLPVRVYVHVYVRTRVYLYMRVRVYVYMCIFPNQSGLCRGPSGVR